MLVYLGDMAAQKLELVATVRQGLQIKPHLVMVYNHQTN